MIPEILDDNSVAHFYQNVLGSLLRIQPNKVVFDFCQLRFIRPAGVVTLSNIISFIQHEFQGIHLQYAYPSAYKTHPYDKDFRAIDFLDDSLFFEKVMGEKLHKGSNERSTTNGLEQLNKGVFNQGYIDSTITWLRRNVHLQNKSFSFLNTALGEIFNNIIDHSGSPIGGCVFAQQYPRKNEINLCIADCGVGIANNMKKMYTYDHTGAALDCDSKLINYATHHKVSTKTTPRNRGMGLETLIYIIENNKGRLQILSNEGSFVYNGNEVNASRKRVLSDKEGHYSGTLITLSLRTNTLEEEKEEELNWY